MSRKIILIKQELLLLVYELNRSGLLAENEKIRPILAQLEKLLLCDLSRSEERFSRNAETDLVCRLLLEKKKKKYRDKLAREAQAPLRPSYCNDDIDLELSVSRNLYLPSHHNAQRS